MLKTIFSDIWRNIYARSLLLLLLAIVVFSFVFRYRMAIYNFYESWVQGPVFDNPYRLERKPYSFQEDAEKAKKFVEVGLKKLAEKVAELYREDVSIKIKQIDFGQENLLTFLDENSASLISDLFLDLSLFCTSFRTGEGPFYEVQKERRLGKRRLRRPKNPEELSPFAYAITENNYKKLVKDILDIDRNYFNLALGKKPDFTSLLYFRQRLYEALCRGYEIPKFWQKALEYREYLAEKKVFYNFTETIKKNPEIFPEKVYLVLSEDLVYKQYLKEFFFKMSKYSSALDMQIDRANFFYTFTKDVKYLDGYINFLLEKARLGGKEEAKESFVTLYALQHEGLEKNPQYLLALAETAFRMGDLHKARALVNQVLKTLGPLTKEEESQAKRLDFILKMSGA